MKKSLEKMRVRIDQNLHRSEKTVALPLELERIGKYIFHKMITNVSTCQRKLYWHTSKFVPPSTRSCVNIFLVQARAQMANLWRGD